MPKKKKIEIINEPEEMIEELDEIVEEVIEEIVEIDEPIEDDHVDSVIEIEEDDLIFDIKEEEFIEEEDDEEKDESDDIVLSKHTIEGKHSLKYDSIFKGKKEETPDNEDFDIMFFNEKFEVDKASQYWFESIDNENYTKEKIWL